jgi:hypothetical protein
MIPRADMKMRNSSRLGACATITVDARLIDPPAGLGALLEDQGDARASMYFHGESA